jgi:hypothetical protein
MERGCAEAGLLNFLLSKHTLAPALSQREWEKNVVDNPQVERSDDDKRARYA